MPLGAFADGLIIVHDPFPMPRPFPPPQPGPLPPPRPLPPPHRPYAFAPLEVTFHNVNVRIKDQLTVTAVDQEFYNPNNQQLEGTYLFPIPKGAQIDKFSMEIGGKQVEAELMAADKARRIYEDIVRQMKDPALLEYAGRDVFKVRIFPIEPHSKKRVKLSYSQMLKSDSGLVTYLYPLNTEKFSAKPIPIVSLKIDLETKRPLKTIYSPSHNVEIRRHEGHKATVGFEAKDVKPDADFQLVFAAEAGDIGLNLMTYRSGSEDGYFLLLASPGIETKEKQIVRKDVTFVLDTSGSMAGKKLDQAKKALQFCIENLNDGDRFEIIRFSTETEALFHRLVEASKENRAQAGDFIKELKPIGGTAIDEALRQALSIRSENMDRPCVVIFLTDGLPTVGATDEDKIVANVTSQVRAPGGRANARVFCFGIGHDVNTHLLDKITEATKAVSQYVLPEEDIEVKVSNFFTKIKEPVLSNLKIAFPDVVRVTRLYPSPLPDLFKGEQLVLAGRYTGRGEGKLTLEGMVNGALQKFSFDVRFADDTAEHDFIPRLWATRRIGYLLEEIRLQGENAELRDEVTELARQYGVVTPYTAYLILEDEDRRRVPLALQSLPGLGQDVAARELASKAWSNSMRERSGGSAVAAARYGLALKAADNAVEALAAGRMEAKRGLQYMAPAAASAGGGNATVSRVVEYTQQARFVNGRNFFQNGSQWIDAQIQKMPQAKRVRIQFNSAEYFGLLSRQPQSQFWLALGQNVHFALGDTIYEIYE